MKKYLLFLLLVVTQSAWADLITNSVADGCASEILGITDVVSVQAIFTPKNVTCQTGQYLPANTLGCEQCPSEATCTPGTYSFSDTKNSGIVYNDTISQNIPYGCTQNLLGFDSNAAFEAVFTPMNITCENGYYLIANMVECTQCPENNYCPGGIYTFSETETQGILPCPETLPYAPVGMWAESQCGRKLYIGGEYLYLHKSPAVPAEHRLYARIETRVYSANATPIIDNPDLKMSANAQRALHVKIDGIEYLIHDDSVK